MYTFSSSLVFDLGTKEAGSSEDGDGGKLFFATVVDRLIGWLSWFRVRRETIYSVLVVVRRGCTSSVIEYELLLCFVRLTRQSLSWRDFLGWRCSCFSGECIRLRSCFSGERVPLRSRFSEERVPLRSRFTEERIPLRSRFEGERVPLRSGFSGERLPLLSSFSKNDFWILVDDGLVFLP